MPNVHHVKSDAYSMIFGSLRSTRYWGKCPDLMVDGKPYEFESYVRPWTKRKVGRMINHGLKQAPNVIIDNTKGCSDRYIRRLVAIKPETEELWVYEKGNIRLLYKKQKATKR